MEIMLKCSNSSLPQEAVYDARFRREGCNHAVTYFLVGKVEQVGISSFIVSLDGQIAALIEHGQWALPGGLVIYKLCGLIFLAHQFVDILIVVYHQAQKKNGIRDALSTLFRVYQWRDH